MGNRTALAWAKKAGLGTLFAAFGALNAEASGLSLERDALSNTWVNHCNVQVYINWTDDADCGNWSCADNIAPQGRSSTTARGQVSWCEWYNGASGKGPC